MEQRKPISGITKLLFGSAPKGTPAFLEALSHTVLMSLAAYVINKSGEFEKFRYWANMMTDTETFARDIVYDVIYPGIDKSLRESVDVLFKNNTSSPNLPPMAHELFKLQPDNETIKALVNDIANRYYSADMPLSVNNLCLAILNPINSTLYHGVAGVGTTCIAAGNYALKHGGDIKIFAQEENPTLCAVAKIRAYINEIDNIEFACGNVLTNPRFVDSEKVKQFDFSILFPPFGLPWNDIEYDIIYDRYERFPYAKLSSKSSSEWLFIQHFIASLKNGKGKGIISVPTGVLFNSVYIAQRQKAIEDGYIRSIITLPANILPHTAMPLSLIVVDKSKQKNTSVLMLQAEELFPEDNAKRIAEMLDEQVIEKITAAYNDGDCEPHVGAKIDAESLIQQDCILLPSRYLSSSMVETDFEKFSVNLNKAQDSLPIEEFSKVIYRGINLSQNVEENESGHYKIINYTDVQDGKLNVENLKSYDVRASVEKYKVEPGDVLISCKGRAIKTCVVPDNADNVLLSINYIGIRLDKNLCDPRYLKYYLDSPAGQVYLKSRQVGTSIITLKNKDLAEMPILLPPLKSQVNYISEYEKIHDRAHEEIKTLYRRLAHAKWQFYQNVGLGEILTREERL